MLRVVVDDLVAEARRGRAPRRRTASRAARRVCGTVGLVGGVGVARQRRPPARAPARSPCRPPASIAAIARYGLTSPPGSRFSSRALGPWPTSRTAQVRLSWPQATAVGANEPVGEPLVGVDVRRVQQGEVAPSWPASRRRTSRTAASGARRRRPRTRSSPSVPRSDRWMWQELPSRSLYLAMKVSDWPCWLGDLLGGGLVDGVVVGGGQHLVVEEADLVLAEVALALGRLDVHARRRTWCCGCRAAAARPGWCRGSSSRRCTGWPASGRW